MRLVCLLLGLPLLCGGAELRVGQPAPALSLAQVLRAPPGTKASWKALKGDAVVLEFWATWCPGCREAIPHLNRLSEQFKKKPIRFISITDEEPGVVQRFLEDYKMSGWIGLDSAGATFKRYGIAGRPRTVLVDASGVVRGIGSPSDLTGGILENLIAGRTIEFSAHAAIELQSLPGPLLEVMTRPAGPAGTTGYSPGALSGKAGRSFEMWGVPLRDLLSTAYGVPKVRVRAPGWADQDKFDVALAAPDLSDTMQQALLRRALTITFQLKAHTELDDTAVYVLRRSGNRHPALRQDNSSGSSHWGENGDVTAVATPLSFLSILLSRSLGAPVFDETRLQGRFDWELKWDPQNHASLVAAVRQDLGLDVVKSHRPLDYVIVDSAVQPSAW